MCYTPVMRTIIPTIALFGLVWLAGLSWAQPARAPGTQPGVGRFPNIEVNIAAKEVRVAAEALRPKMPLEFFCVTAGGSEHEAAFRTRAPIDPKTVLEPGAEAFRRRR